jgi:dolichol kinase
MYYKWYLSPTFSNRNPVCTSPLFHTCNMPLLSHYSLFDHPNYIKWAVQIIRFLVTYSSPIPGHLVPLDPNILLSTLFWNALSLCASPDMRDHVSRPYKTTGNIVVLCILIFIVLNNNLEDKSLCTQRQ